VAVVKLTDKLTTLRHNKVSA